ncbi:hypothetical protein [Pseudoduganella albidiflava]|uniref:Stereocilin n=1 Tax=Pseudoduganella albidiflava TaxID=321983 RepID=A0A411X0Q2_9BURK|nr:hypothetical protein [Pseudoduganella albidiflava]QBI02546.1 hypothetical protein EYF70_18135 [Pseudoduganella albidiflava]GGY41917.1 hypothetical protein GCM10007387_24820 [Pseudoduganella albidiflava]
MSGDLERLPEELAPLSAPLSAHITPDPDTPPPEQDPPNQPPPTEKPPSEIPPVEEPSAPPPPIRMD